MKHLRLFILFSFLLLILIGLTFCGSESGTTEPRVDPRDIANELISFTIEANNVVVVSIEEETKTIRLLYPYLWNEGFENLAINFEISLRASANLVSGNSYDLRSPQSLIITSVTGEENIYMISAELCSGTAVIISDTQNDIIPLFNQSRFFTNINKVIDKAHDAGVPSYYIMLKNLVVNNDSSAWRLPEQLHKYEDGILIDKDDIFNAFDRSTILHKSLMKRGIGKVIIVGVSSMGCVIGTCRGAGVLKYDVTLIRDAHAEPIGYRTVESVEECNVTFINENIGRIITADELTF